MPNYPDSIQDLEPLAGSIYKKKIFLNEVRTFLDQKHRKAWCVAIDIENFKLFNDWFAGRTAVIICFWKLLPYLRNLHQEDNYITGHFSADDFLSACQMTVTNSATFMQQFIITLINWNKMMVFFHPSASIGLKTNL